jgi:hypothetical protein
MPVESDPKQPPYLISADLECSAGSDAPLLAGRAAFAVQKVAIEREERHLQARFGKTYVDYAERVRLWI